MWREWNVRLECASREKVECGVGREVGREWSGECEYGENEVSEWGESGMCQWGESGVKSESGKRVECERKERELSVRVEGEGSL